MVDHHDQFENRLRRIHGRRDAKIMAVPKNASFQDRASAMVVGVLRKLATTWDTWTEAAKGRHRIR
ncbi:MAG: hypothetical protein CMJ29_06140 [Phycisphaerae bacterium]|nr:hypothetical protein [Phycisphaerae bacterium]